MLHSRLSGGRWLQLHPGRGDVRGPPLLHLQHLLPLPLRQGGAGQGRHHGLGTVSQVKLLSLTPSLCDHVTLSMNWCFSKVIKMVPVSGFIFISQSLPSVWQASDTSVGNPFWILWSFKSGETYKRDWREGKKLIATSQLYVWAVIDIRLSDKLSMPRLVI